MYTTTKALVLRSVQYRESSRILTVLTADHGKLTVSARGAVRKNSRVTASAQPLAFSDMTLSKVRDRYILVESQVIEQFEELSSDLVCFALGVYFAELLEAVSDEDSPSPEMLSLGLNALYGLCKMRGARPAELIKAAFELRLMCLSGYAPALDKCSVCGGITEAAYLDLSGGALYCADCSASGGELLPLCAASQSAARHVCSCDSKRLYSFLLEPGPLRRFSAAAEGYLLAQLDRKFGSLDYYYRIKDSLI